MPFQEVPKDTPLDPVASGRFAEVPREAALDKASSTEESELPGLAAAAGRGLAPVATGAAIGAAAGAPFAGVGAIPGAIAGAGAAGLTELATSLYNPLAERLGWPKSATPQEMTDRVLDYMGTKRPSTVPERLVEATAGGAAGAYGEAKAAGEVAKRLLPSTTKGVVEGLAQGPGRQAVSGAAGGAAAQTAAELGLGPLGQGLAGLAGGSVTGIGPAAKNMPKASTRPEARRMIESGYVLPPTEAPPLGEKPSGMSAVLGAQSGKIKLQQDASTRNQLNTNKLAAQGIGLHPDTVLTENAFEEARAPAKSVYTEVQNAVPEIILGADPSYRKAIEGVGKGKSLVERFFPDMKDHPEIKKLREDLLQWGTVPTEVATAKIADLRHQASTNFKAIGDNQKHALAWAQRDAAAAMEDALERSITNAPAYNQSRLSAANREQNEAVRGLAQAQAAETHASQFTAESQQVAAGEVRRAQDRLAEANSEVQKWQKSLQQAQARGPQNDTLIDRFKKARTLFAKIYNVEDATNVTTGNVSAPGLARMFNKGAPLSDELKTIAEAFNTAPKSMQVPENFGRSEDWSGLDFFGTALAAVAGHPVAAAGILGRPTARRTLLSPRYQESMTTPKQPSPSPLPLILNPGAATSIGIEDSTSKLMGLQ